MSKLVKILGLSGSLRASSYNTAALRYAQSVAPSVGAKLTLFEGWGDIPAFNQDDEGKKAPHPSVVALKAAVKDADAILYAIPEYNYGLPGGLKNAIDAASRPYGDNSWSGKPAGIMSASIGMLGGARAQYQLRQCFVFLNQPVLNAPEVMIPFAGAKFDKVSGALVDADTQKFVKAYVQRLVDLTLATQAKAKL